MLKVIIADDEQKVALLIKSLIDWTGLGMELVGIAKNGAEALEILRQTDPDIIITDIRMPITGGLELISEAKEIKPSLEFIIISGYKHFDYAHSAIKYGVSDYLLKPIKQDELNSTLEKVKERIAGNAASLHEHERALRFEQDEKLDKRLRLFDLIYSLDDSSVITQKSLNSEYLYNFEDDSLYRFVILKIDGASSEIYSDGLKVFTENIREMFIKALTPVCDDVEVAFSDSKGGLVLGFKEKNIRALSDALKDVFDAVRIYHNIFPSAVYTMAGGPVAEEPAGLIGSWKDAEWTLCERLLLGAGSFYKNLPVRDGAAGVSSLVKKTAEGLELAMDVMDFGAAERCVSEASDSLSKTNGLTGKDIISFAVSVYDEWLTLSRHYDSSFPGAEKLRQAFAKDLDVLSSADDVYTYLLNTIKNSIKHILENLDRISGRPVSNAKLYIRENYSKNISISDIADKEGFNVSYFSTLFKKETGQTFSEYLSNVRMNEAKRLLKETNLSVALVCEAVGYSDLKHFNAIFRKNAGIKPSEYRKLYSWGR